MTAEKPTVPSTEVSKRSEPTSALRRVAIVVLVVVGVLFAFAGLGAALKAPEPEKGQAAPPRVEQSVTAEAGIKPQRPSAEQAYHDAQRRFRLAGEAALTKLEQVRVPSEHRARMEGIIAMLESGNEQTADALFSDNYVLRIHAAEEFNRLVASSREVQRALAEVNKESKATHEQRMVNDPAYRAAVEKEQRERTEKEGRERAAAERRRVAEVGTPITEEDAKRSPMLRTLALLTAPAPRDGSDPNRAVQKAITAARQALTEECTVVLEVNLTKQKVQSLFAQRAGTHSASVVVGSDARPHFARILRVEERKEYGEGVTGFDRIRIPGEGVTVSIEVEFDHAVGDRISEAVRSSEGADSAVVTVAGRFEVADSDGTRSRLVAKGARLVRYTAYQQEAVVVDVRPLIVPMPSGQVVP